MPEIEILYFTDPYCTWCWGSEPILRKIKEVYGEQVKITYIMGGLVEDMESFYDPLNEISRAEQVAPHWLSASERHGMPVSGKLWLSDPPRSTFPANIAYHAAKLQSEEKAEKFLRRMREAAAAEDKNISRLEVLVELAREVGLDAERFVRDFTGREAKDAFLKDLAVMGDALGVKAPEKFTSEAEKAFYRDLKYARNLGVTGFPTFLVRNEKGEVVWITGYQPFSAFEMVLEKLSPGLKKRKPQSILAFVEKYGRVATREVAEVFDLSDEEALAKLEALEKEGKIRRVRAGNGCFWERV